MFVNRFLCEVFAPKMNMSIIPALIGGAAILGSAAISKWGGGGGGGSGASFQELLDQKPSYQENEMFTESQEYLKNLGFNILGGDVPDYYKAIGETGGQEFEDALDAGVRDISASTAGSLVTGNRGRGGAVQTATAKAVGDYTRGMRFQDWERSLTGKTNLLGIGADITSGVRSSAYTAQQDENQFNSNVFSTLTNAYTGNASLTAQQAQANAGMWGDIASSGIGAAGMIYANKYSNPAQAAMPTSYGNTMNTGMLQQSRNIANQGWGGYGGFSLGGA